MKKFLTMLFAATLVVTALSCGKGKEPSKEEQGEDDNAPQTSTVVNNTASTSAPSAAPAAAAAVSPDAGTLSGVIKLAGTAAPMPTIQMSADPVCNSQHQGAPVKDEEVVVGPGGELANVFVYIKNISGNFPAPSTPVTLDQKGCQYHPHISAVQVGQTLNIKNSDATLHNIHAMPVVNSQFNVAQPVPDMVTPKTFDKPELTPFRIKCDVHGWMKSYLAVMPHPFYSVSKMDGTFTIPNLPPGSYTLVAWHEKYGSQEQQVTVGPKETKTVNFNFKG